MGGAWATGVRISGSSSRIRPISNLCAGIFGASCWPTRLQFGQSNWHIAPNNHLQQTATGNSNVQAHGYEAESLSSCREHRRPGAASGELRPL